MIKYIYKVVALLMLLSSCDKPTTVVVVGSMNGTEQRLLGEIVAQHLEKRLGGVQVQRQFEMGDTPILYQSLLSGQIDLYPEYSGAIVAELLKEPVSPDPMIVFERARIEMARRAQIDLLSPLGFDARFVAVVRSAEAPGVLTLSQAAAGTVKWTSGIPFEFQSRSDGLPALNGYRLPLASAMRPMQPDKLFGTIGSGEINMLVTSQSDSHLTQADWRILEDDRHLNSPQQAGLLVSQDALKREPKLRAALDELSGKLTLDIMRKLNAEVDLKQRTVVEVASEFLRSVGP